MSLQDELVTLGLLCLLLIALVFSLPLYVEEGTDPIPLKVSRLNEATGVHVVRAPSLTTPLLRTLVDCLAASLVGVRSQELILIVSSNVVDGDPDDYYWRHPQVYKADATDESKLQFIKASEAVL